MSIRFDFKIRPIPVKQITILNPRERGKKKFAQIVANIAKLGLKRPITVSPAEGTNGDTRYILVCGQGRLEAYLELGQEEIPAILAYGTREELMLMSLAENLARRRHSTIGLLHDISLMKGRGHTHAEIARKIDVDVTYVRAILQLLAKGEERLLQAVEKGQLPVSIAITIATSDDKGVQRALQEGLPSGTILRGNVPVTELAGAGSSSRRAARARSPAAGPANLTTVRSRQNPCSKRFKRKP